MTHPVSFFQSSNARTQSSGWLHDADHTIMEKLSRYFDHVTGLQVSRINPISLAETRPFESESFQVRKTGIWRTDEKKLIIDNFLFRLEFTLLAAFTCHTWTHSMELMYVEK